MDSLHDRVAIVTGASRGIGRAIARRFGSAGAAVVAAARERHAEATAAEIRGAGGRAVAITVDVTDVDQIDAMVRTALDEFGRVDVIVNNAGIARDRLALRMSQADWDAVVATNLTAAFICARTVLRPMLKQRSGRIISVGSVVGQMGNRGQVNYAASKAGLVGFSKALAREGGEPRRHGERGGARDDRDRHERAAWRVRPLGDARADSAGPSRDGRRRRGGGLFPRVGRGGVYYWAGVVGERWHVHVGGTEWPLLRK